MYSVNIVYFDLGHGEDYIYHGKTAFKGLHLNDELAFNNTQKKKFSKNTPGDIYPEIYLIKVNNFNDLAVSTLDEWVYFLKNTELPNNFKAKGLTQVEQHLNYEKMNTKEKNKYDEFIKSRLISKSMLETAIEEGKEEGSFNTKVDMILSLHENGIDLSHLAKASKLSEEEVLKILKERGEA